MVENLQVVKVLLWFDPRRAKKEVSSFYNYLDLDKGFLTIVLEVKVVFIQSRWLNTYLNKIYHC